MNNILIVEAANDLHDGVYFADVRQKFVPQTFARRRALHQDRRCPRTPAAAGINDLRFRDVLEHGEPRVRHRHDADVRVDRAKRIIAASALRVRVTALNRVDLPTLGSPTIPAFSIISSAPNAGKRGQ